MIAPIEGRTVVSQIDQGLQIQTRVLIFAERIEHVQIEEYIRGDERTNSRDDDRHAADIPPERSLSRRAV